MALTCTYLSCQDSPIMLVIPRKLPFNQSPKFSINLVAFAALKVCYKHWNHSQVYIVQSTHDQLFDSRHPPDLGICNRSCQFRTRIRFPHSLVTVIILNAISIPKSRGNIILASFRRFCFFKLNTLSLSLTGADCPSSTKPEDICCLSPLFSRAR